MRTLTFDLEIEQDPTKIPGGWGAARSGEAGISALIIHDDATGRFHIYDGNRVEEAARHLCEGDVWVSFNGRDFDVPVIQGYLGHEIAPQLDHIDLLQMIWGALGRDRFNFPKGTWGLGATAQRTLGLSKSSTGVYATQLCAEGRFGELFDYCLNDVHVTRQLYEHICRTGYVLGPDDLVVRVGRPELAEVAA